MGTEHIKTPLYHPMANGLVERFNRTLGSFIQTAKVLGGDLTERIQYMISMYNASPQSTTGISPSELLHGRRMRTKLDVQHVDLKERRVDNELREVVEDRQEKQKNMLIVEGQ